MNQAQGVFEIVKKEKTIDPKTGKFVEEDIVELIIEHAFMFLSNLTSIEEG